MAWTGEKNGAPLRVGNCPSWVLAHGGQHVGNVSCTVGTRALRMDSLLACVSRSSSPGGGRNWGKYYPKPDRGQFRVTLASGWGCGHSICPPPTKVRGQILRAKARRLGFRTGIQIQAKTGLLRGKPNDQLSTAVQQSLQNLVA